MIISVNQSVAKRTELTINPFKTNKETNTANHTRRMIMEKLPQIKQIFLEAGNLSPKKD